MYKRQLEKWPLTSLQKVSPAIADIIFKLEEIAKAEHDDPRVAIIDEHDTCLLYTSRCV